MRFNGFDRIISFRKVTKTSVRVRLQVSAQGQQQFAQQLFQQLIDSFSKNVFSYPLLGIVLFVGLLWFFHEFREWRLSISVLASVGIALLLLMLVFTPFFSPFIRLFGFQERVLR